MNAVTNEPPWVESLENAINFAQNEKLKHDNHTKNVIHHSV
jgi:hypothetical protein